MHSSMEYGIRNVQQKSIVENKHLLSGLFEFTKLLLKIEVICLFFQEFNKHDREPSKYIKQWTGVKPKTGASYTCDIGYERFMGPEVQFASSFFISSLTFSFVLIVAVQLFYHYFLLESFVSKYRQDTKVLELFWH